MSLRVFTLLVLALEAGEKHGLTFVRRPELEGGVRHFLVTAFGATSLHGRTVGIVFFAAVLALLLPLALEVLQLVERNCVFGHDLGEGLDGNLEFTGHTEHVAVRGEGREEGAAGRAKVDVRAEGLLKVARHLERFFLNLFFKLFSNFLFLGEKVFCV